MCVRETGGEYVQPAHVFGIVVGGLRGICRQYGVNGVVNRCHESFEGRCDSVASVGGEGEQCLHLFLCFGVQVNRISINGLFGRAIDKPQELRKIIAVRGQCLRFLQLAEWLVARRTA